MSLGNLADTNPKQIRVKKKNKKADSGGPGSSCRVGFRIDAPTPNSGSLISLGEAWEEKKKKRKSMVTILSDSSDRI